MNLNNLRLIYVYTPLLCLLSSLLVSMWITYRKDICRIHFYFIRIQFLCCSLNEYLWRLMFQQIQAQTIIVIHPGSMYLRMGRASDLKPITLLHAIARRRLSNGTKYKDSFLPLTVTLVSTRVNVRQDLVLMFLSVVIFGRQRSWRKRWKSLGCRCRIHFNPVCSPMEAEDMLHRHNK